MNIMKFPRFKLTFYQYSLYIPVYFRNQYFICKFDYQIF